MQSSPSPVCEYYTYFWKENRELRIEDSFVDDPQSSILYPRLACYNKGLYEFVDINQDRASNDATDCHRQ